MFLSTKNLPYERELFIISEVLKKKIPDFPECRCKDATLFVGEFIGLQEVGGKYTTPEPDTVAQAHYWNFDPERKLHVDLTQHQFEYLTNLWIPTVSVLSQENPFLQVGDEEAFAYYRRWKTMKLTYPQAVAGRNYTMEPYIAARNYDIEKTRNLIADRIESGYIPHCLR